MSPTIASLPAQPTKGIKGKKVPGKPGRFDPDRPLHMTTRKAKRQSVSGGAPSLNGSVGDYESRRPSLDADRPTTAHSSGTQASKGTYASDFSPPQPVPDIDMSEAPQITPADAHFNGELKLRSISPVLQPSPTTRKRKRSSPSPPLAVPSDEINQSTYDKNGLLAQEDAYDSDTVEVVPPEQLSDREDYGNDVVEDQDDDSPDSSQSQELEPSYDAMAGTSVDVTPMLSEQPSPATSGSPEDEDYADQDTAIAKPLAAALKEVADAKKQTDPTDPEQLEDEPMLEVAAGIEDADEMEEQVRTDDDGRMVVRRGRFGGRRRAQHPNPSIEVAMRRQAQLKSAYRAMARAQKSILVEMTSRTIDDLETNPNLHTEVNEYDEIVQELDAALVKRKAAIRAQHEMRMKQLKTTWDGEQDTVVAKCRQQLEDIEETKVDQLQYEILRIARNAQLEDGNETEDEDDVIPRLKRTAYHFKRGVGLDTAYDSRSRLAIETLRATEDMQARYNMYELLKDLPDEDRPEKRNGFTVMDKRPRTAASKIREGQDSLEMLAAAGDETERRASLIIPNEQALALQMLSSLATRPSIMGGRPQSSGMTPGHPGNADGPPQLQVQVPRGNSPIQVQMSPRTQQAMGNRFEPGQMPPPLTPRQDAGVPANPSPDARRHERRPSSPGREERPSSLYPPSPARRQIDEIQALHNRIASRDTMLQESLFGSPRRPLDFPGWRPSDAPDGPRRRAASQSDIVPPFGFRSDPTPHYTRDEERRLPGPHYGHDDVKNESPRFDPVRSQTLRWTDQHSQAGATNGRSQETASPASEQFSLAGTPGPLNSAGPGADSNGNKKPRHRNRGSSSGNFPHKTSKAERKGLPRRQFTREKKQQQQYQENGSSESAGTPTMGPAQFAGSPPTSMPSPWSGGPPPARSPHDFPHSGPHHHGGSYSHHHMPLSFPPPPPQSHLQHHSAIEYSPHHRNSFPPLSFAYGFPPQPHSPFPPGLPPPPPPHHIPPPPGVQSDQYHRFPPPPPPSFQQGPPPPPPHTPQTSHPPSVSGTVGFGNHTRGPVIAPAGAFPQGGFRQANPPPAFAQQQQQQNGGSYGSGNRRRAQSDASFVKFQKPWSPKY